MTVKVSDLPVADAVSGSESLMVVQAGASKKVSLQNATIGKLDKDFNPSSVVTASEIVKPASSVFTVNPPASSEGIFFANFGQTVWVSEEDLIAGGHTCGAMGWSVLNSAASLQMVLGVEGRIDLMQSGTINLAKPLLGLLVNGGGNVTDGRGVGSEINNGAGRTIDTAYGFHAEVTFNGGTIDKYVAFGMPNMQGVIAGITQKFFIENLDTAAPIITKSPTVQQDYGYAAPTTGAVFQIPNNISDFTFLPAGTLATLTVVLPPNPYDGQNVTFSTTQILTSLTVSAASGAVLNAPTTLPAGGTVEYKFIGNGIDIWVRKR